MADESTEDTEDTESTESETESRAERLTNRRERSRERTQPDAESGTDTDTENNQTGQSGQTGQSEQTEQTKQTGETGQSGQSSESDDDGGDAWSETSNKNVKRENVALYMYIDERQHDAVTDAFEDVRYHYRKAYDVELEKNRHVYPLILEHGLEAIREIADSPAEVRNALDANSYTPVPAEVPADA